MSIADYGMFKIAQQNLISARAKVRNLTLWFSRQKRQLSAELSNMRHQKNILKQQLTQSIFAYSQPLQQQMQDALSNNDQARFQAYQSMIYNKQYQANLYMQQWEEYSNNVIEQKQREMEELEAQKEIELEEAKADKEYWAEVKKSSKEEFSNGIKEMFGNRA